MARRFDLTRPEDTRDSGTPDPIQFTLSEIKAHFEESLTSIESRLNIADALKIEGKIDECKDIWRSQIIFLDGILDFYLHEISKYVLYKMFLGEREKSREYDNLQISIKDVEDVIRSINDSTDVASQNKWFYNYLHERFYYNPLVPFKNMKRQLELLNLNFSAITEQEFSYRRRGKEFITNFSTRRNDIAHRFDRSLSTAERNDITKEYVEACIADIRCIVDVIHRLVEENDEATS